MPPSWRDRRYSSWLLEHEEQLRKRMESTSRLGWALALTVVIGETLAPWDSFTPGVPALLHIVVAAVALPALYLAVQADLRRKEQAFALALSDKGRRLLFLDPYLEPEEFALSEQLQGAQLLPLQRQLDAALKAGAGPSLHRRLDSYYRTLPSPVHEGDRLGPLSFLHLPTFVAWAIVLVLCWLAIPHLSPLSLGGGSGLSLLPLLALLYLYIARANTRFAYETAVFDWLRGV